MVVAEGEVAARPFDGRFATVVAAALAYFLGLGILAPVLPRYIEDHLDGGGTEVGVAVGAFAVTAALLRPWVGRVGDRRGRRVLLVTGAGVAAVATLGYGLPGGLAVVVLFRLVHGAGEAAAFIGAATMAQDLAPADRRGQAASLFSISVYGGLSFGPVIGDWVYRSHGPGWAWAAAAAASLLGAAIGLATDDPHASPARGARGARGPRAARGEALPGSVAAAAASPGAAAVPGSVPAAASPGAAAVPGSVPAAASPGAAAAPPGSVPAATAGRLGRWLHPAATRPGVILALGASGYAGFASFVPLYVDDIGLDAAGPVFFEHGAIVLAVRIFWSRLPDVLGPRRGPLAALVLQGSGLAVMGLWGVPAGLYVGTAVYAAGVSLLYPALFPAVVGAAPEAERSQAIATFTLFFDLSQGLGAPLLGVVVSLTAERGAFLGAAALSFLGLLLHHRATPSVVGGVEAPCPPAEPGA